MEPFLEVIRLCPQDTVSHSLVYPSEVLHVVSHGLLVTLVVHLSSFLDYETPEEGMVSFDFAQRHNKETAC